MSDIIISDLSVCQPADRLDRGCRYGTWRLIDYETEGFAGTMVYSGPGMGSEPLALPLNREGIPSHLSRGSLPVSRGCPRRSG